MHNIKTVRLSGYSEKSRVRPVFLRIFPPSAMTLFRCADGFLGLLVVGLACLVQFCVVVKNELFEDGVTRKPFEMVLSHFVVRTIRVPAVVCHAIDSGHHTGTVAASLAVYEY